MQMFRLMGFMVCACVALQCTQSTLNADPACVWRACVEQDLITNRGSNTEVVCCSGDPTEPGMIHDGPCTADDPAGSYICFKKAWLWSGYHDAVCSRYAFWPLNGTRKCVSVNVTKTQMTCECGFVDIPCDCDLVPGADPEDVTTDQCAVCEGP